MESRVEYAVASEVPAGRRQEILRYFKLFGYKPDSTIIQVHVAGFFNKKGAARDSRKRAAAAKRYGGTTFTVVGRTHDPAILERVIKPRNAKEASPGYMGYMWMNKDPEKRPPHELVPLDFVPLHVSYPGDWKAMFATKAMLLAMHVPSSFAGQKSQLTRALYRLGKGADAKEEWRFLDELERIGYRQAMA
ncbi:MAG: hypothetical protein ACREAY_10165 [Nitrososphaera sp.]|uniref:hypothetical protein n=1 Tax=Nitrososphaera sp. TaxID=1971748 RepID=UPI003D6FA9AA